MFKNKLIFIPLLLIAVSLMIVIYLIIEELTIEVSYNEDKESKKDEILKKNNRSNVYNESHKNKRNKNVNSIKKKNNKNINVSKKENLSGYEYFNKIVCKKFGIREFPYFENIKDEELYERYIKGNFSDLKKIFNDKNIHEIKKFALLNILADYFMYHKNWKDKNFVRLFKNFMNKYIAEIVISRYEEGGAKFWGKTWERYLFGIISNLQSEYIKRSRLGKDIFGFRNVFAPILDKEFQKLNSIEDLKSNKNWPSFLEMLMGLGGKLAHKNLKKILSFQPLKNKIHKKKDNIEKRLGWVIGDNESEYTDPKILRIILDSLLGKNPLLINGTDLFGDILNTLVNLVYNIRLKKRGFNQPCPLSKEFNASYDKFRKMLFGDYPLYKKLFSHGEKMLGLILVSIDKNRALKDIEKFIEKKCTEYTVLHTVPGIFYPDPDGPITKKDVDYLISKIKSSNSVPIILAYGFSLYRFVRKYKYDKKFVKKIQDGALGTLERLLLDNKWLLPYQDFNSEDKTDKFGKSNLLLLLSYLGNEGTIDAIRKWHISLKSYKAKNKNLWVYYSDEVDRAIDRIKNCFNGDR